MPLFTAEQLTSWLQYATATSSVTTAEAVVKGWLLTALELDELPTSWSESPGSRTHSWALELGGIAYENPTSMTSETNAEETSAWSMVRRREILEHVRTWGRGLASSTHTDPTVPRSSFPPSACWPDPIRPSW